MKRYLLLLLLLFPFYVKAVDGYNVSIEDDNIQVKLNDEIVSDYSNVVEYNNRVLTVKKGAVIKELSFNDIDLTITSNNKVAYIGYINHGRYALNPNVHKKLIIRDFRNDENQPFRLDVSAYYTEIEVYNSAIYQLSSLWTADDHNNESGLLAKDSILMNGYLHTSGPIILENIEYDGGYVQSENSYISVKNSNLRVDGNFYTDGGSGHIDILDSSIDFVNSYSKILLYGLCDADYSLYIKNSSINNGGIGTSWKLPVILENVDFTGTNIDIRGKAIIKDSNVVLNSSDTVHFGGMDVENSSIKANNRIDCYTELADNSSIKNSIIEVGGMFAIYQNTVVYSSYLNVNGFYSRENFFLNNSYLKVLLLSKPLYYDEAFKEDKNFYISNSYFYLENCVQELTTFLLPERTSLFNFDEGLSVADKDGVELKLVYREGLGYSYYYDAAGNNPSRTVTLRAKATVTFKIENGAWADGSINDIVITKDVWDTLNPEDIPELPELPNGHWEIVPSTDDYIKGDVTYVYVIDEVKGVEEIEENPKTGINYIYTIISFIIAISLSIMYFKYFNKTYFMKG